MSKGRAIGGGRVPRTWPVAVGLVLVGVLAFYLSQRVIKLLRDDAEAFSRVYQEVQAGLTSPEAGAELEALTRLQRLILDSKSQWWSPAGRRGYGLREPPFRVSVPPTPDDLLRISSYAEDLDTDNAPVGDPGCS